MPYISLAVLGLLLVLLYLRAVRPQRQFLLAQQQVIASLQVGDRVVTSAGIFGRITGLSDDVADLEVAPGVVIQVARPAITRKVTADPDRDPQRPDLQSRDPQPSAAQPDPAPAPPTADPATVPSDAVADGSGTEHPASREDRRGS